MRDVGLCYRSGLIEIPFEPRQRHIHIYTLNRKSIMSSDLYGRTFLDLSGHLSRTVNRRQQAIARASHLEAIGRSYPVERHIRIRCKHGTLTITAKGGNDVNLSTDLSGDVTLNGSSLGVFRNAGHPYAGHRRERQ